MIWRQIKNFFDQIFNIIHETDEEGTIKEIYEKVPVRGNNTWMLICSIMLASIGLDVSSSAVIIGAMLISPLMSPILGVGLALGINDREMLIASTKNLSIATLAGLGVSTLYFFISPFGEPTPELIARTQPTLLDVMVAFFGGLAGIISISRSDKSNAIPGVAIATALMPPLCTAGYGLANGDQTVFFGAFYLFLINAVFISLATFLIVRYLEFEVKHYLDKEKERRIARLMAVLVFIAVIPSVYFLYNVYNDIKTKKKIETLVVNNVRRHYEILKWEVHSTDSLNTIKIYSVGNKITPQLVQRYDSMLLVNNLADYRVKIVPLDVSGEGLQELKSEITGSLLKTVELEMLKKTREDSLREAVVQLYTFRTMKSDMAALFPELKRISMGEILSSDMKGKTDTITVVNLLWEKQPGMKDAAMRQRIADYELKIRQFLKMKLNKDSINVRSEF